MGSTENNLDIVAIIKACGEAKVRRFEFGKMKIQFGQTDEEIKLLATPAPVVTEEEPTVEATPTRTDDDDFDDTILTDPDTWIKRATGEIINEETH